MLRSQRLEVVLQLARREEQALGVRLERAQQQLQLQCQQLAQLKEYSLDYARRIDDRRQGVRIQEVVSYRQFLQQLALAEDNQVKTIAGLQRNLEQLKRQWGEKFRRRKLIEGLIGEARRQEAAVADRREQKVLDELAANGFGRRQ